MVSVAVEGLSSRTFFMRSADLATLNLVRNEAPPKTGAAIIGALDNLTWDRDMLRWIFDFDYVWEVYKPAAKRKYGYYVLPVIYGDRFVARFDPAWDRKKWQLTITNWWWEAGVEPDEEMAEALVACFREFMNYLGAQQIDLGTDLAADKRLLWVRELD